METPNYRDRKTAVAGDQFPDDSADGESYLNLTLGGWLLESLSLRPHSRLASLLHGQFVRWQMLGVVQPLVLCFGVSDSLAEKDPFRRCYVM